MANTKREKLFTEFPPVPTEKWEAVSYTHLDVYKRQLVHYTSGAMTVKHQGTWHKLIRSMLVSVTLYLFVCVFFITLYFSYVHPLIRKSLPGMEGNLLGAQSISVRPEKFTMYSPSVHPLSNQLRSRRTRTNSEGPEAAILPPSAKIPDLVFFIIGISNVSKASLTGYHPG